MAKYYHCIFISNILPLKLEPFQGSSLILILFAIYIEFLRDSFGNSIKKHSALPCKRKKVVYLRNGFLDCRQSALQLIVNYPTPDLVGIECK